MQEKKIVLWHLTRKTSNNISSLGFLLWLLWGIIFQTTIVWYYGMFNYKVQSTWQFVDLSIFLLSIFRFYHIKKKISHPTTNSIPYPTNFSNNNGIHLFLYDLKIFHQCYLFSTQSHCGITWLRLSIRVNHGFLIFLQKFP